MMPKTRAGSRPYTLKLFLGFSALLLAPALARAAADHFNFVTPPTSPYAAVTYVVSSGAGTGIPVTFSVQALNPGGTLDTFFTNHPVTVALYDTATGNIADPTAIYIQSGSTPVTGASAPMTFMNGVLNFGVTLTAGSNSMQVSIMDTVITTGATYPGTIGVTTGPGYIVEGYTAPFI